MTGFNETRTLRLVSATIAQQCRPIENKLNNIKTPFFLSLSLFPINILNSEAGGSSNEREEGVEEGGDVSNLLRT